MDEARTCRLVPGVTPAMEGGGRLNELLLAPT